MTALSNAHANSHSARLCGGLAALGLSIDSLRRLEFRDVSEREEDGAIDSDDAGSDDEAERAEEAALEAQRDRATVNHAANLALVLKFRMFLDDELPARQSAPERRDSLLALRCEINHQESGTY